MDFFLIQWIKVSCFSLFIRILMLPHVWPVGILSPAFYILVLCHDYPQNTSFILYAERCFRTDLGLRTGRRLFQGALRALFYS